MTPQRLNPLTKVTPKRARTPTPDISRKHGASFRRGADTPALAQLATGPLPETEPRSTKLLCDEDELPARAGRGISNVQNRKARPV